jgi:hypothetical protein
VQISSQSRSSCAVLCHSLLMHPADASVLASTHFIPINPYKSALPEDDQGLFYCIWHRRLRSDGHGIGGIRRRGGGGERGEICWVEEEACGASGIGLRVKWYFYCTVQTRTVQPQPQNGLSNNRYVNPFATRSCQPPTVVLSIRYL